MSRRLSLVLRSLLVAGSVLLASCASTPRISTDFDEQVSFTEYRTFAFFKPLAMEPSGYSTPLTNAIRQSIRRELTARGYVYDESAPQLLVNFQGVVQERTNVYNYPYGGFDYFYNYRSSVYYGTPIWFDDTIVSTYTEGTLSVDLVDAKRNQMVWTGSAIGRVRDQKSKARAIQAGQGTTSIFAQYPFRADGAPAAPVSP